MKMPQFHIILETKRIILSMPPQSPINVLPPPYSTRSGLVGDLSIITMNIINK